MNWLNKNSGAYSINEMLIVIVIIVILASATISGTGRIVKNLRFSNTFNQLVFLFQKGRNLAIAGKSVNAEEKDYLLTIQTQNNGIGLGTYTDDSSLGGMYFNQNGLQLFGNDITNGFPGEECGTRVWVKFKRKTGDMDTDCPGSSQIKSKLLEVGLYERNQFDTGRLPGGRQQTFIISKASGLIQVQAPTTNP